MSQMIVWDIFCYLYLQNEPYMYQVKRIDFSSDLTGGFIDKGKGN